MEIKRCPELNTPNNVLVIDSILHNAKIEGEREEGRGGRGG